MRNNKLIKKVLTTTVAILMCVMTAALSGCSSYATLLKSDIVYGTPSVSSYNLGTVARKTPITNNGGLDRYPEYGKSLAGATAEEKQRILDENTAIYDYDQIDVEGNLYKAGTKTGKKLTKHSAADGLYYGGDFSSQPAIAKKVRINPSNLGDNMTGLYAPPGEIVTIIMDEKTAARNMRVDIGQGSQRGGANNIPAGRDYNRMPALKKTIRVNKVENYVGSPLGGPIYLMNENDKVYKSESYEVTIIGAIEMPHYILGATTDADWEILRTSKAPLFDMETYAGVRLTMPATYIKNKTADEMRKVAELWDNASQLANKVSNGGWYAKHPVSMIFDTFVPAGAAVAFVGADFCILPPSWGANAIDYNSIITQGMWGNIHEMNHHHQGWGAGDGGEVTNNVINAMVYCLYTNIGTNRTESGGLGGGNWVTSSSHALTEAIAMNERGEKNRTVSMYVNLLHAFGDEVMVKLANKTRAQTEAAWYTAACEVTGYDMTYYLRDLCGFELADDIVAIQQAKKMPVYVPVASLYQEGQNIIDKFDDSGKPVYREVNMGKPYYIPYGETTTLDFDKNIVTPKDIEWEIVDVSNPVSGKLTKVEGNKYQYAPPQKNEKDSFYIELKLSNANDSSMQIGNVKLKISLQQDSMGVSGKIWHDYTFASIDDAIEENIEGAAPTKKVNYSYAGSNDADKKSGITIVEGKIIMPLGGKYQFFVKGDDAVQLYTGAEKGKLQLSAFVNEHTPNYSREKAGSFFTVELNERQPLYFKMYVLNNGGQGFSRIGYVDYSQVEGANQDSAGGGGSTVLPPIVDIPSTYVYHTDADINVASRYVVEVDRKYARTYKASGMISADMNSVVFVGEVPAMYGSSHPKYMLDNDSSTMCHTRPQEISEEKPVIFRFKLGDAMTVNSMSLTYRIDAPYGRVKDYKIYFANTAMELNDPSLQPYLSGTFPSMQTNQLVFKTLTAKYMKLEVTDCYLSNGQEYVGITTMKLGLGIEGAEIAPSSGSDIIYKGNWSENKFGSFINGVAYVTNSGIMEVNFHGTDFALFAMKGRKYGKADIRVDGGAWQEIDFYNHTDIYSQPIFIAAGLNNDYHKIEVKARDMINIDYLAFKPTVPPPPTELAAIWWVLIALAIAAVCAGIGVGAYFATKYIVSRREQRLGTLGKYGIMQDDIERKTVMLSDRHLDDLSFQMSDKGHYNSPMQNQVKPTVKADRVVKPAPLPKKEAKIERPEKKPQPKAVQQTATKKVDEKTKQSTTAKTPKAQPQTAFDAPTEWLYTPNESSKVDGVLFADTSIMQKPQIKSISQAKAENSKQKQSGAKTDNTANVTKKTTEKKKK